MALTDDAYVKACCADLYESPWAREILGDPLHPGGLALTNRLGRLMNIGRDHWVADLASARGTSAMAISRAFHCRVVGVEFGAEPVVEAHAIARESADSTRGFFLRGDAEAPPLATGRFAGVVCECSLSLFPDKPAAVAEAARLLQPGGRLGISDFAVTPGTLPTELQGTIGQILCLAQALDVNGYVRLLQEAGLTVAHQEDASDQVVKILDDVDTKLAALPLLQMFSGGTSEADEMLQQAPRLVARIRQLVAEGNLGYWLLVAEKPGG